MAVLLPKQTRNANTYQGEIPQAQIPANATRVDAAMLMDAADIADPTLSFPWAVDGSWDNGVSWQVLYETTWTGGALGRGGTPATAPVFSYTCEAGRMPDRLRGRVVTPKRFSWGLDVTVV